MTRGSWTPDPIQKISVPKLLNKAPVERFLRMRLGIDDNDLIRDLQAAIPAREQELRAAGRTSSFHPSSDRAKDFARGSDRLRKHAAIIDEILAPGRTGEEGAHVAMDRQAFLVVGAPGVGKSTVISGLARSARAVVLDADDVKFKLPEFSTRGAAWLQAESALVVEGANGLVDCAIHEGMNFIQARIGRTESNLREHIQLLQERSFDVHLILVRCDLRVSVRRVLERFRRDGRYVPMSYCCGEVGTVPEHVYAKLRRDKRVGLASYSAYDNGGSKPSDIKKLESDDLAPPFEMGGRDQTDTGGLHAKPLSATNEAEQEPSRGD